MAIGKSRRIVIDVDDVALKRDLYSALGSEGRSLKDWFSSAVTEYLAVRAGSRTGGARDRVSEKRATYRVLRKSGGSHA